MNCTPNSLDNVYFDANSFTSTSQTVTMDVASSVGTMHWGGATNSPRVAGNGALNIYGSLTLSPNMTWTNSYYGAVSFLSGTAGNTITLGIVDPEFSQHGEDGVVFDVLSNRLLAKHMSDMVDRLHQRMVERVVCHLLHKTAVDLDEIDRQVFEVSERADAAAKVVQ